MTPSTAWLNVSSRDTSMAIISASTHMAVLIRASPFVGEQSSQNSFANRVSI